MGFLIKSTVWLGLAMLVIPLDAGPEAEAAGVGPLQAFHAAREAVFDIGGLCERKPDVCDTGRAAMRVIAARTREASRIALDYLDEPTGAEPSTVEEALRLPAPEDGPAADAVTTGSVPPAN